MTQESEKTRILESSRSLFFAHGFGKVTVDEIASDLRMSKKTIYKFFPTKEDLVRGVIHFIMHFVKRNVDSIVNSNRPFEAKMTDLLSLIGSLWSRVGRKLPEDMKRYYPQIWKELETFRREQILSSIKAIFYQAKEEGLLRNDVNIDILILMFLSSVDGILNPFVLSEHSFSLRQAFQQIFSILFQGSLTPEARDRFRFLEPTYMPTL
ncbi:MAG: TetR/AcrR family transcriptional regulator [Bacteroidota bacterium]